MPDAALLARALRAAVTGQPALCCRWELTPRGLVGTRVDLADRTLLARHDAASSDVDDLVAELVARPIRYDDFPLMALDLIRHPGGSVLVQRAHHLVFDGWSVGVFLGQVQDAYRHFARGDEWQPIESAVTYFDWAAQQRRQLPAHSAGPLFVAPAESRSTAQPLGEPRSVLLERVAARLGVTPFAFLLAAFRRLVSECHGVDQQVIWSGFANRDVETADVVGRFAYVLPLVRSAAAGETAAAAVRAELALVGEAGRHQRMPDLLRYPILFSQCDSPMPEPRFGDWRPELRDCGDGHTGSELNVVVLNRSLQHARSSGHRGAGAYTLRWEHDLARYPEHVVTGLRQRYVRLLDHACAHPDQPWPQEVSDVRVQ